MYFQEEKNNTNIDDEFNEKKQFKFNISKKMLLIIGIIGGVILAIGIYILLPKEPPIEYFLVLNDSKDIIIYQDMEYVDAGYEAYDNKGNKYNQDVVVEGRVDTTIAGEYIIKYIFNELEEVRTITVLSKSQQLTFLVLLGDKTMYLKQGEQYQEPGYNVIDSVDVDLVDDVKVVGEVNVNVPGTYKLEYSVINQLGVEFKEERTVIVLGTDISISYSPEKNTNGVVSINLGIVDNYFDYIMFPNGTKEYKRYTKYDVSENGVYKFVIYSKNGSYQEKEIEIKNIDKDAPTGSCSGYYKEGKSYITINANDNMSSVSKFVLNQQTFQKNSFTVTGELATVTVTIYDDVGNASSISCNLENKNPPPKPSSSAQTGNYGNIVMCNDNTIYPGTKYNLTQSQKEKLAAMVYHEGGYNYIGMKAVASHMANLYERKRFYNSSITASLYDYMHNNGWYASGTRNAVYDGSSSYMRQALQAVEEVIVGGNRILPHYIDEFDWFPNDVVNAMDKSKYVQGETIYYNIYGDSNDLIVFWCFNLNSKGTSGNIFGYVKGNTRYHEYVKNK